MLRTIKGRLTFANVVSVTALFVALAGGTAYAINDWGSADIIDNTLRSVDIKNDEIRTADVRNDDVDGGGLAGIDIAANALTGADVKESSLARVPSADNGGRGFALDLHTTGSGTEPGQGIIYDRDQITVRAECAFFGPEVMWLLVDNFRNAAIDVSWSSQGTTDEAPSAGGTRIGGYSLGGPGTTNTVPGPFGTPLLDTTGSAASQRVAGEILIDIGNEVIAVIFNAFKQDPGSGPDCLLDGIVVDARTVQPDS